MRCEGERSVIILTYYVIKVRICATRSMGGNADSARWALMVAFVDALFDALPAEFMTALRVEQCVTARLKTDGTAEVLIDDGLEGRKDARWSTRTFNH